MSRYVLALDQGTTSSRAILFDNEQNIIAVRQREFEQLYPQQGWVEHDPMEIWSSQYGVMNEVVAQSGVDAHDIAAIGITNQRETTILWEKATGRPIYNAIVWQCRRTAPLVDELLSQPGMAEYIKENTGLVPDAYFSATKIKWILDHVPGARERAQAGEILFGTVDSWLIYKLTGGNAFLTDASNASRTQLFNLETCAWDEELCAVFGIPMELLPQVMDSDASYGSTDFEGFLDEKIPIRCVMGDSHAALFGQGCHRPGMVKATYGTGSSIMMHVGERLIRSSSGLSASLAWSRGERAEYVLEGNINYTGAVITWLKEDLGLLASAQEAQELAEKARREDGTLLIPAFSGLSAPYWSSDARALICGMSRTTGRAELVKAALESIAYQITDVLDAMEADSKVAIQEIRADGGPAKNRYLMQFQSDLCGKRVLAARNEAASVTGAAYMAGIAAGLYDEGRLFEKQDWAVYDAQMSKEEREKKKQLWKQAVGMALTFPSGLL